MAGLIEDFDLVWCEGGHVESGGCGGGEVVEEGDCGDVRIR